RERHHHQRQAAHIRASRDRALAAWPALSPWVIRRDSNGDSNDSCQRLAPTADGTTLRWATAGSPVLPLGLKAEGRGKCPSLDGAAKACPRDVPELPSTANDHRQPHSPNPKETRGLEPASNAREHPRNA